MYPTYRHNSKFWLESMIEKYNVGCNYYTRTDNNKQANACKAKIAKYKKVIASKESHLYAF